MVPRTVVSPACTSLTDKLMLLSIRVKLVVVLPAGLLRVSARELVPVFNATFSTQKIPSRPTKPVK